MQLLCLQMEPVITCMKCGVDVQMGSLSKAEVEEKLAVLVGDAITSKLKSSNWKERLEAMGDLQQRVQDMKENIDVSILFQVRACSDC